jgi:predicted nucleic acid-binding protein
MDQGAGPRGGAGDRRARRLILADTSAWVEYLRRTGSPPDLTMDAQRARGVAVTEPVLMELLAGAMSERLAGRLREVLIGMPSLAVDRLDYDAAATFFRACRRAGRPMRSQLDCLIAAVAIRNRVPLLHYDDDFDFIAQHTALEIYGPG